MNTENVQEGKYNAKVKQEEKNKLEEQIDIRREKKLRSFLNSNDEPPARGKDI